MMDFRQARITGVITHLVGNKSREELVEYSTEYTEMDDITQDLWLKYCLHPFKTNEFYQFTHSVELKLNAVFTIAQTIFANPSQLLSQSVHLANLLYDASNHPKIKSGEMHIVYFEEMVLEDELVNAIGIFKTESRDAYLKFSAKDAYYEINKDLGIGLTSLDKGCLIFETDPENGYKIALADQLNRSSDVQFWKETFLQLQPCADYFHHTRNFLNLTKTYLEEQIENQFDISKPDKIDLLNRSLDYFKNNETFEVEAFADSVLIDDNVIQSFQKYKEDFEEQNKTEIPKEFQISTQAVKKEARKFKEILKLDENFEIRILAGREHIEKGTDENGRKFYKLYYEEEN